MVTEADLDAIVEIHLQETEYVYIIVLMSNPMINCLYGIAWHNFVEPNVRRTFTLFNMPAKCVQIDGPMATQVTERNKVYTEVHFSDLLLSQ